MISLLAIVALEGKTIDLDMTPEKAKQVNQIASKEDYDRFDRWIASFADIAYPFIDVWNFQAVLSFMVYDSKGNISKVVRLTEAQHATLGLTVEMIHEAVYENGALNMSGHYPISEPLRRKLVEVL